MAHQPTRCSTTQESSIRVHRPEPVSEAQSTPTNQLRLSSIVQTPMLSEPPRCRPVPVRALKGADSPRGLHRGHSPGHGSPPGARSTGGGWSLPASWPDPNSLRQLNPDHDETSYEDRCVKSVLLSAGRHRPVPPRVGICGCRGGAPHGEGALANLVSGGMASTPRSLIRVRGAPRRAAPLYVIGAVGQPTSHHGHRSLGPTGPAPPGGSGPIRRSAFAGAPPACPPPAVPL